MRADALAAGLRSALWPAGLVRWRLAALWGDRD